MGNEIPVSTRSSALYAYSDYAQACRMNGIIPAPFEVWLNRQHEQGKHLNVSK